MERIVAMVSSQGLDLEMLSLVTSGGWPRAFPRMVGGVLESGAAKDGRIEVGGRYRRPGTGSCCKVRSVAVQRLKLSSSSGGGIKVGAS